MDGMRLVPRRNLGDMVATGPRKKVRDVVRVAMLAVLAVAFVALLFETHRQCESWHSREAFHQWAPSHRFIGETGIWPLVVLMVAGLGQWWALRGGMALSIVFAVLDLVLLMVVLGGFAMVHLLSHTEATSISSTVVPAVLILGLLISVAQIVIEPWAALTERRAIERTDPVFPSAIVVRSPR